MSSRPRPSLAFRERGLLKGTCSGGGRDGTGSPLSLRATQYIGIENGLHRSEEGQVDVVG